MDNPKTWHPLPTVYEPGPYTVPASNSSPGPNETVPRRSCCAKDSLILQPSPSIRTVYDILRHSAQKYNTSPALGSRKLIRTYDEVSKGTQQHAEGKAETVEKTWTYYEMGPYHFLTFKEYEEIALKCGSGLRKLGMEKGDRLHLFAGTTPCWLAMAHGAASQSLPIVTAYDTLGETGLQHSLCQTHAKTIFTEPLLLPSLINPLKAAMDIQYVIYNDTDGAKVLPENVEKLKESHPRLTVLSFSKLQAIGNGNPYEPVPPDADDLCCIMYTSGSTGAPKGVLLKHKNVVAAVAGADAIVGKYIGPTDRLLAYLPLAHIFEFMFENASLFWGCTMGYGSPKTLSDRFVRSCAGDIREFRPTVMVGVPSVWETVKKGILSQISSSNVVARGLFWAALALKEKLLDAGLHAGVDWVDWLVFSKIKAATGGKLRICMNGGGPVAKGTQRFISTVVTPMIGGYGLTETCGFVSLPAPALSSVLQPRRNTGYD
ncbi:MAG: hypothetical protein Q9167_007025 [Letrouitia subvulpina]